MLLQTVPPPRHALLFRSVTPAGSRKITPSPFIAAEKGRAFQPFFGNTTGSACRRRHTDSRSLASIVGAVGLSSVLLFSLLSSSTARYQRHPPASAG